jgi:GNAT superfamily N-acetyltransferase
MDLHPVTTEDLPFVFECLDTLRGQAKYSLAQLEEYVRRYGLIGHADFLILIGRSAGQRIGMLTCNRFAMPRYLGFGYELEEVIVHPTLQGKGHGAQLVRAFLDRVRGEPGTRKVIVKTDDAVRAGRVYRRHFEVVATTVYGTTVNRL